MLFLKRALWVPALVCAVVAPASAQVGQVGVASVAIGDPLSKPPQQAERVLRVGEDVFANERISTKKDDRAHLVFRDGSALTIGPNSDLVLDRFVFDPNTRAGDIAVNVSRGAFRFVGGAISKQKDVIVQTPSATVGIRGGVMAVSIGADGSTTISFLYGRSAHVSNRFGASTAYRAGSQIVVPAGGAPLAPVILPPGAIETLLTRLEPPPGARGALGNEQTFNAHMNNFNSVTGPEQANAGLQKFASMLKADQVLGTVAVNQATVLASSSGQMVASVPVAPPVTTPPVTPTPPYCPPSLPRHYHHHYRGGR